MKFSFLRHVQYSLCTFLIVVTVLFVMYPRIEPYVLNSPVTERVMEIWGYEPIPDLDYPFKESDFGATIPVGRSFVDLPTIGYEKRGFQFQTQHRNQR